MNSRITVLGTLFVFLLANNGLASSGAVSDNHSQELRVEHYKVNQSISRSSVKRVTGNRGTSNFNLPGGSANNKLIKDAFNDADAGLTGMKSRAPQQNAAKQKKVNTALETIVKCYIKSRHAVNAPVGAPQSDKFLSMIGNIKLKVMRTDLDTPQLDQLRQDLSASRAYLASWSN